MAKVLITGFSNAPVSIPFVASQTTVTDFFARPWFIRPELSVSLSNRRYNFTESFGEGGFTETTVLKGKLNQLLPFEDRKIRSFKSVLKTAGDIQFKVEIDEITGLSLANFTDPTFNSLKKVLRGDDQITGAEFSTGLLRGYKGNDTFFLKSFNEALGGPGADAFVLSTDTRDAKILDFKFGVDSILIDGDINDYTFESKFGFFSVENAVTGTVLATVQNINQPSDAADLELLPFISVDEELPPVVW